MLSTRSNTSSRTVSTTCCQRWFLDVMRTSPGPLGIKGRSSSGWSALSNISNQRAYGSPRRSASSTAACREVDSGSGGLFKAERSRHPRQRGPD